MIPFMVLIIAFLLCCAMGSLGVPAFSSWIASLRAALAVMFLFTASAHWGKRRPDIIRMVPPPFPRPELLVTVTGVLEILGAIGLLIPATAPVAAACLALLLIVMFPANIYAARKNFSIGGKPVTALPLRTALQLVFITALMIACFA